MKFCFRKIECLVHFRSTESVKIVVLVIQDRCVLVRFNGFCFRTRTAIDLNSQKVTLQILLYFLALKLIPEEHKPAVIAQLMYNKRK